MAPFIMIIRTAAPTTFNSSLSSLPTSMPPSSSSTGVNDAIINIIFGILACIIGVVTIYHAHRARRIWHTNHSSSMPRGASHTQSDNNISLPPYPETPYIVADGARVLSRTVAETSATSLRPSEGPTTAVPSERPGIQVPQSDLLPMNGLTSLSTNDENIEQGPGVVTDQQR